MKKVVINVVFGGFGLSPAAREEMGLERDEYDFELERDDHRLVACVEKLGDAANGAFAKLRVVEIPDDVHWHIEEFDGNEHIAEDHRTWY